MVKKKRRSTTPAAAREAHAERLAFALNLRKDGHTYAVIGRLLGEQYSGKGFTDRYAHKLVKEAIKSVYKDDVEDLIRLEIERLDSMYADAVTVLRNQHVVISSGAVVHQYVKGEDGRYVMDAVTGMPLSVPLLDDGPRLAAIDRLLKIQERRSKLLGLDKPTKIAPTNPDGDKPAIPWMIVASKEDLAL